jgi:hypothetical protein
MVAAQQVDTTACARLQLHVEGALRSHWSAALARLCSSLALRTDLDRSAYIRAAASAHGQLRLVITLADGRTTERQVHTTEELSRTLEALLVLPNWPAPELAPETQRALATAPAENEPPPRLLLRTAQDSNEAEAPTSLGLEIGVELAARLARAPTYLNPAFGLYAGAWSDDWWLGVELRWEPYQYPLQGASPSDFEMDSVAGGVLIARRVMSSAAVRLNVGADLLMSATFQSFDRHGGMEASDTLLDARAGVLSRLLLGTTAWRWAFTLGADLSPLRVRRGVPLEVNLPVIPVWSVGLGVGVARVTR